MAGAMLTAFLLAMLLPTADAGEDPDEDRPVVEVSPPQPVLQEVIASRLASPAPLVDVDHVAECGEDTEGTICIRNSSLRPVKVTLLLGSSTMIPIQLDSGGARRASLVSGGSLEQATLVALTRKGDQVVVRRQSVQAGRAYEVVYNASEKLFELRDVE